MAVKDYIFELTNGFTIESWGKTPRDAFTRAKRNLKELRSATKQKLGDFTGRYALFSEYALTKTFPRQIRGI